jgi:hypothetical protein
MHLEYFFLSENLILNLEITSPYEHCLVSLLFIVILDIIFTPELVDPSYILDELNAVEKVVEEFLTYLMVERVMSERRMFAGVQASFSGGFHASPSTTHDATPSRTRTETRTKHRDDIANAKLIPCILPVCIVPLTRNINHDSVPKDFEYNLITTYLSKGMCVVRAD